MSAICLVIISNARLSLFAWVIVVYGFSRVLEIVIYQCNVLLFDPYRASQEGREYELEGYRRIVLLLLHNYVEIILWFACTYVAFAPWYDHKWTGGVGTIIGGLYSSFITMTTFGEFDLQPQSKFAAIVLLFQSTAGLFLTILSLARFIGMLPIPRSKDPSEVSPNRE